MYKIVPASHGIDLTFGDFMMQKEMESWLAEFQIAVDKVQSKEFTVFVDMRTLKPLPTESQAAMEAGQRYARENGMVRSVVILDNPVTTLQFKRIAKQTGTYNWERYIDAQAEPNWREVGMAWLTDSVDPDVSKE